MGAGPVTEDAVRLDAVTGEALLREGRAAGLRALGLRKVPETEDYVGSDVALLAGPD